MRANKDVIAATIRKGHDQKSCLVSDGRTSAMSASAGSPYNRDPGPAGPGRSKRSLDIGAVENDV